jgi:hypothetical protein
MVITTMRARRARALSPRMRLVIVVVESERD